MASIGSTRIGRLRATVAAAVVVAGLTVGGSAPALASPPRACVPGKIVDFCRPVPPGHGFRLDDGVYQTIDGPGASLTVPFDINDRGQVVGSYLDAAGKPQGFRLDDGVYTVIDTSAFPSAQLLGLNDRGEVVGGYLDPSGKVRGLLRDPKGTFTVFDAPMAASQTGAFDINDRRQIVGVYR